MVWHVDQDSQVQCGFKLPQCCECIEIHFLEVHECHHYQMWVEEEEEVMCNICRISNNKYSLTKFNVINHTS